MRGLGLALGVGLLASAVSEPAAANVTAGTLIGVFSNVATAGNVLNDPSPGATTFIDNSGTAIYSITNSTNPSTAGTPPLQATGSMLTWGDNNGGAGQASSLDFSGAPIPSNINQNFRIGSVTYVNGASTLPTNIFGATISFYANSVSPGNFLGSDRISISNTVNNNVSPAQDADYVNVCGNQSNVCNISINAIEASEGGSGVTFDLFGTIVGDPQLYINMVQLAAGQSSATNGFLASDPPIGLLPEPGTVALIGTALFGLALLRRARPQL